MKYCRRCLLPESRPNIRFDATGTCGACLAHEWKGGIDWREREMLFKGIVDETRLAGREYDCLIPVSGGKDSTWQVATCLRYGLRPLAVTWRTPGRTAIGERNLQNLIDLGVDHFDVRVNPKVERRFHRIAFESRGATAIPMHMAIFNIPLKIAIRFGIPLIVWGENSAFEYGGEIARFGMPMDGEWLSRYGVTNGTTAEDWISTELSREDLTPYFGPSAAEMGKMSIQAVFLGDFFRWDPAGTFEVARAHGFSGDAAARTGIYDFADIDDDFISIHHHLKWYKFGITRAFDNLSLEIRNGRLSREEAIDRIRRRGEETPVRDIGLFCDYIGISREDYDRIAERFRNPEIWKRVDGIWTIPDFIVPDWKWS